MRLDTKDESATSMERLALRASCAVFAVAFVLFVIPHMLGRGLASTYFVGCGIAVCAICSSYNFAEAIQRLVDEGKSRMFRTHAVLLAVACMTSAPVYALLPNVLVPDSHSLGMATASGAFVFGIGMRLSQTCVLGILVEAGTCGTRGGVLVGSLLVGCVLGCAHWGSWNALPALPPVSLLASVGVVPALGIQLVLIAMAVFLARLLESRVHGAVEPLWGIQDFQGSVAPAVDSEFGLGDDDGEEEEEQEEEEENDVASSPGEDSETATLFGHSDSAHRPRGSWDEARFANVSRSAPNEHKILMWFAILGVLCATTLLASSETWRVTSGISLAGSRLVALCGFKVHNWAFWKVNEPIWDRYPNDYQIVQDISIILATACACLFDPSLRRLNVKLTGGSFGSAMAGGVCLGYGAMIGAGCNIGGFVGGVTSFSLHAWLWLMFAALGSMLGSKLQGARCLGGATQ